MKSKNLYLPLLLSFTLALSDVAIAQPSSSNEVCHKVSDFETTKQNIKVELLSKQYAKSETVSGKERITQDGYKVAVNNKLVAVAPGAIEFIYKHDIESGVLCGKIIARAD